MSALYRRYAFRLKEWVHKPGVLTARDWMDEYTGTPEEIDRDIDEDLHRYGLRRSDVSIREVA